MKVASGYTLEAENLIGHKKGFKFYTASSGIFIKVTNHSNFVANLIVRIKLSKKKSFSEKYNKFCHKNKILMTRCEILDEALSFIQMSFIPTKNFSFSQCFLPFMFFQILRA